MTPNSILKFNGDDMFIKLYCIALPIFFGLDMVWLGVAAKNFYKNQIGFLMTPKVNWGAAVLFYLLFLVGFARRPVRSHHLCDLRPHESGHAQGLASGLDPG
jgi:hypothetical protein